jgi:tight adherence protein C
VLFAQQLNFQQFVPFAIFGLFAAVAWWIMGFVAGGKPRTLERLDELKNPGARRRDANGRATKKADAMARMIERATPALAKPLAPKNEQAQGKLKLTLANAGFRGESAVSIFLGLKFLGLLGGLFIGGGTI